MAWRLVDSLIKLRNQANLAAPNRNKSADGTIGDGAHSARKSDHNPEDDGTVDALDLTHDPLHGWNCRVVVDAIIASKDPRVLYIIFAGEIISGSGGPSPWVKRKYSGSNGHYHHMHVSVRDDLQDDTRDWAIGKIGGSVGDNDMTKEEHDALVKIDGLVTDVHGAVARMERMMAAAHCGDQATADAIADEIAERLSHDPNPGS